MRSYYNNEDAGDLEAFGRASWSEALTEREDERKRAHYADWLATREGWARHGYSSDDTCEDGCGKVLTPENIYVSNDGWFCEDCADDHFRYGGAHEPQEDFGADM